MRFILLTASLISTFSANSAEVSSTVELFKDCDQNQLAMNACASDKFNKADKKLNELFRQKLASLERAATKERLRSAQRAWVAFRDKDCLFSAGPSDESGSIWEHEYFSCMRQRTEHRIEELKAYLECTQNGCPN